LSFSYKRERARNVTRRETVDPGVMERCKRPPRKLRSAPVSV